MDLISSLFQAITLTIIALLTSQINPPATPTNNHNVAKNLASPTPEISKLEAHIFGPILEEPGNDATPASALIILTLIPTKFPTPISTTPSLPPTKIPIPSKTPSPTKAPYSIGKPTPTSTTVSPILVGLPTQIIPPLPSSLDAEYIFSKINLHRENMGLASFEKEEQLCRLASTRALEIYDEIFTTEKHHAGLRSRQIPYWINENIASFQTEDSMIDWWLNDYIHRIAVEGNYRYSCVACSGKSCVQLFTSFIPK